MDKDTYFIAVASSDGIVVNSHFGRADKFYIYKVENEEEIKLVETREVLPVCEGGNHNEDKLKDNLLKLSDCKYLLVSRIGNGAMVMAESLGIEAYELPGIIEESTNQLIKYVKIQNLFH